MKQSLLALITVFSLNESFAQLQFTLVDPVNQGITLKNFGTDAVDVSDYRMCSLFNYTFSGMASSGEITIQSGDFDLAGGEEVTFQWASGGGFVDAGTGADLNLYLPSGLFDNPANMVCFMQYGSGGNGRESEAVDAGLWEAGTFVTGIPPYSYTGDGSQSGVAYWTGTVLPAIVINEVDCDSPSSDNLEFVELFGEPNQALDGLVIVYFNGLNDAAYEAYDLDGYQCNDQGFFVLGNAAVANVSLISNDNSLQNGADAVALYAGNADAFADGALVTSANLIDAVVYDTDDMDDTGLLGALTPGQNQLNESAGGASDQLSISRVPDGGEALNTSSYVTQLPTPGVTNVLPCDGGIVSLDGGGNEIALCLDEGPSAASFTFNTAASNDAYLYVVANQSDQILFTSSSSTIDFGAQPEGTCHVFGVGYNGVIDPATIESGDPVLGIEASLCASVSANFVSVTKSLCNVLTCEGGQVIGNGGGNLFEVCLDETTDIITFSYMTSGTAPQYEFILANALGVILQYPFGPESDFNAISPGTYQVFGINFDGALDPATTEIGDFLSQLSTDGQCFDLTETPVTIVVQNCGTADVCDDLFFSEYVEGSSNNKAFEIFNPTNADINLEEYEVVLYNNGSIDPTTSFVLPGTLAAQQSFVVANFDAAPELLGLSDETSFVCEFNGDDVLHLVKNGEVIDVFGVAGTDPGLAWDIPGGSAMDHTLVRKSFVTSPVADWTVGQSQWDVYDIDDFSHLGTHEYDACSTTVPQISFTTSGQGAAEGDIITVTVSVTNPVNDAEVTVSISGGTATENDDYTSSLPVTMNFPEGSTASQSFTIEIVDDTEEEDLPETINLVLSGNEDDLDFLIQTHSINILPSDQVYPLHTIAQVTTLDDQGIPDSLNVSCELVGIVHGINYNDAGLDFALVDGDAGINVFLTIGDLGYTVTEGDEVSVEGSVTQYEGLASFLPVEITLLSSGNSLQTPDIVTEIDESHESGMVRVECVKLVDPNQWTNSGLDFVVTLSDGVNEFNMLIESECALYGTLPPEGHFTVVGIGHQRDPSTPYDGNYMLRPRYITDLTDFVIASFITPIELTQDNDFVITNNSVGASTFFWDFGDGATSNNQNPVHEYDDDFVESLSGGTVTISLVVESSSGCVDSTSVDIDVLFVGIDEAFNNSVSLYPNPAVTNITVEFDQSPTFIRITNLTGEEVYYMNTSANLINIDISNWARGLYLLQHDVPGVPAMRFVVN